MKDQPSKAPTKAILDLRFGDDTNLNYQIQLPKIPTRQEEQNVLKALEALIPEDDNDETLLAIYYDDDDDEEYRRDDDDEESFISYSNWQAFWNK